MRILQILSFIDIPGNIFAFDPVAGWVFGLFLAVFFLILKMFDGIVKKSWSQNLNFAKLGEAALLQPSTNDPYTWTIDKSQLISGQRVNHVVLDSIINDFSDGQNTKNDLELKIKQLNGLREIDLAILSTMDMEEIIKVVLGQIDSQLGPEATLLYLIMPDSEELQMKLSSGVIDNHAGIQKDISQRALQSLETVVSSIELDENKRLFQVATPLIGRKRTLGVLELYCLHDDDIPADWLGYLEIIANQLAIATEHVQIIEQYEAMNDQLQNSQEVILKGWAKALEFKDRETQGHSDRVTVLTRKMGIVLGLSSAEIKNMIRGALLHDIGKMAIPDEILFKNGPLSDDEWVVMKKHPLYAQEFLQGVDFLNDAMMIPLYHHERLDGSGYPYGLSGDEIPLSARIFAIIDVWDALTHWRPYRPAWSHDKTLSYLQELSGNKLDAELVDIFVKIINQDIYVVDKELVSLH